MDGNAQFDFERLWDERTAALFLRVSLKFLQNDRTAKASKRRIPYIKVGSNVRYDPADVRAYVEQSKVRSS